MWGSSHKRCAVTVQSLPDAVLSSTASINKRCADTADAVLSSTASFYERCEGAILMLREAARMLHDAARTLRGHFGWCVDALRTSTLKV